MVLPLIRALIKAVRRDLTGYGSLRTNNFFLFVGLLVWGALVSGVEPVSSYPFLALLAFLLIFPITSDPMEKIPRVRLSLWPAGSRARYLLRVVALALNPLVWITIALLVRRGGLLAPLAIVAAAMVRTRTSTYARRFTVARLVPPLPQPLGLPVCERLRAMLAVLDTWLAIVIAAIASIWRFQQPSFDPAAGRMLAVLVGIALSTQAQCSDGLDHLRNRLLPASFRRILVWHDTAYLLLQVVLTLALDPVAGATFGMAAIAAGRYPALHSGLRTQRWRFTSGRVLFGVLQMIAGAALAFAGWPGTLLAVILWAISFR